MTTSSSMSVNPLLREILDAENPPTRAPRHTDGDNPIVDIYMLRLIGIFNK
jgi:hypothetical protein